MRRELRKFYGYTWRTVTRLRILARAGHRCEKCGVANYAVGVRSGKLGLFHPVPVRRRRGHEIRIVLTVAHLDRIPGHDTDDNLKALCRYCHSRYDRQVNLESAHLTRSLRKDSGRPLLNLQTEVKDYDVSNTNDSTRPTARDVAGLGNG